MRLTVERKTMMSALKFVSVCVNSRNVLPILMNVVITARDGKIHLLCSNLKIEFEVNIVPVEIYEEGETSVNAKKLLTLLESVSANAIQMESDTENYHLHIKAGKAEFLLLGLLPTGFPQIRNYDDKPLHSETIDTELLNKIFSATKFACSREDSRVALTGVNVEFEKNQISAYASDGKVLSCIESFIERNDEDTYNVIYPPNLYEMFSPSIYLGATIKIHNYSNYVVIEGDSASITSKIIDTSYPNVKAVIPDTSKDYKTFTVDAKEFDEKCKLSTVFSTESNRTLSMTFANKAVEFLTTTEQNGTYKDSIESDIEMEGEGIELRFTVNYLSNIIHSGLSNANKLNIMFNKNNTPIVFYDNSSTGTLQKIVLMPLRPKKSEPATTTKENK